MRHLNWEQKISALVDNELAPSELTSVKAHTEECPSCRAFYESAIELNKGLESLKPTEVPYIRPMAFEPLSHYKFVPKRSFVQTLRPAYVLATIMVILLGTLFIQKLDITGTMPGAELLNITDNTSETYLDRGYIIVNTAKNHTTVVTPWAKIVPVGTIFMVTQEPNYLEVSVVLGEVLIYNKKDESQVVRVTEKNKFYMDEDGDFTITPLYERNESGERNNIGIESWRTK